MITRSDIYDALSMLIANAADKTPDAGEMTIRAWADYFGSHPRWNGDDLVAAAHEYCQRPRERLVQPADLGEIIGMWYQDKFDRGLIERDDPYRDLGGLAHPSDNDTAPKTYRVDRHGHIDKSDDWDEQKLADCEHPPGEECIDPECGKPSTFGPYCARHYCLSFSLIKDALK